jgi:Na+-transporting methylmalonyl-CoA/oxaloacetate decarboxylase beta subunit
MLGNLMRESGVVERLTSASSKELANVVTLFLLMHAMGANTAGQVASVVAGGVLLALLGAG